MLASELIRAPDADSHRLMVVLHGLGDSREGYRWLPDALRLPWLHYLLVDAPDPYYEGFAWFDIYQNTEAGVRRSRSLLRQLLDSLPARGFPCEETLLFGFSQGSLLAVDAGLRYPGTFAGIIGVSGWVHDLPGLLKEIPPAPTRPRLLLTHGTQDPLIPIKPVREQAVELERQGLRVSWREFQKPHTIAGEEELGVIRHFIRQCFESAPTPASPAS
jgi:phospholipase/carboxylesterase